MPSFTSLGGSSVPVHPGLQGSLQADLRAVVTRPVADPGCERSFGEKCDPRCSQERHRLRDQGPALFQRVSGHGQ